MEKEGQKSRGLSLAYLRPVACGPKDWPACLIKSKILNKVFAVWLFYDVNLIMIALSLVVSWY